LYARRRPANIDQPRNLQETVMSDTVIPVPRDWKERAYLDKAQYDAMYA